MNTEEHGRRKDGDSLPEKVSIAGFDSQAATYEVAEILKEYGLECGNSMADRLTFGSKEMPDVRKVLNKVIDWHQAAVREEVLKVLKVLEEVEYAVNPAAPKSEQEQEEWSEKYEGLDIYDLLGSIRSRYQHSGGKENE